MNFDLPFTGHPADWQWTEDNIGLLAVLFCHELGRDDLIVKKFEEVPVGWGLTYKDPWPLPAIYATSVQELGRMGVAYFSGYRNAKELVNKQAKWINIAREALASTSDRPRM